MFSRSTQCFYVLLALLFSQNLWAQDKVAVIDVEKVIFSTDFAKKSLSDLENNAGYKTRLQEFRSLTEELRKLQQEAQTNSLTWSEDQKSNYQKDLQLKAEQRQLLGQQLDKEQVETRRSIQAQLAPKLEVIIKTFVEEKKIDLLLNAQTVVYRAEATDVTAAIIERVNAAQ